MTATVPVEAAVTAWHIAKFGRIDERIIGAKLAEEAGEVCGALIKIAEGRATLQHLAAELGDALICLSALAGRHGWTLDQLRTDRWAEVQAR